VEIKGIPIAVGTHRLKLGNGAHSGREYLLHVPPAVAAGPWRDGRPVRTAPLVLVLHGGLSHMGEVERLTGFSSLADREGFLVAYPNGHLTTWNAGGCCGPAKLAAVDDVGFLERLIDDLAATGLVDPARIHATGFSNGAGMALRLACAGPGRLAAVGAHAGSILRKCAPDRPISVLITHGAADRGVPIDGGGKRDFNDDRPFPPVSQVVDLWRKEDGLPALRATEHATEHGPGSRLGEAARCRSTGKDERGVEVAFCAIGGLAHRWPPQGASAFWEFFAAHPRTG
jgi:polyhydroxybutyrate depolymerase